MTDAICAKNLSKNYGKKAALCGVSLSVEEGELFGLLGVNGAGKTTLIKILTGLCRKSGGTATVGGYDLDREMDRIKEIVDVSPQETAVAPNLTVEENLDFFAGIYGKHDPARKEQLIRAFGLGEVLTSRARTLSGGWARRLSIAAALISEPKILFLDEPTLGLDVLARRELWSIIRSLKGNITIVLTSHYLEEMEALCDRVAVLCRGKLLAVGTTEELCRKTGTGKFEEAFVKMVEGNV